MDTVQTLLRENGMDELEPDERWACLACLVDEKMEGWPELLQDARAKIERQLVAVDPAAKFQGSEAEASGSNVYVLTVTGQQYVVPLPEDLSTAGSVRELRSRIKQQLATPEMKNPRFRLLFNGKELKVKRGGAQPSLAECNIVPGSQLQLIMAFSQWAGMSNIQGAGMDQYGNANGSEYDLTLDGAFEGCTVAVLQLYDFDFGKARAALTKKGFGLHIWTSPPPVGQMRTVMAQEEVTQLWVISDSTQKLSNDHLQVRVRHAAGTSAHLNRRCCQNSDCPGGYALTPPAGHPRSLRGWQGSVHLG